jgi:tRNA(Ile)-lysidine synthase
MVSIINGLETLFATHGNEPTYWLGYSGGLDSEVLLHLCYSFKQQYAIDLQAVHINHAISPFADKWETHCRQRCQNYHIRFHALTLASTSNRSSLEAVLRTARYAALAQFMKGGDILLTAHHEDDQAETLLIQLCRGAGPKGLASMPAIKSFSLGYHARPLLDVSKLELQHYAQSHDLPWLEDESNSDMQFTRNFIRHECIPLLRSRWPTVTHALARSAAHCADSEELLQQYIQADLTAVRGENVNTLSLVKLRSLATIKQLYVLRAWFIEQNVPLPNTKKLHSLLHMFLNAKRDKQPQVTWQGYKVRRFKDELHVLQVVTSHSAGGLSVSQQLGAGLNVPFSAVQVKFRQGGEVIYLGQVGHRSLKKLLQEWKVPPWQRDHIPLIFFEDCLVQVVGFAIDPNFKNCSADKLGWVIETGAAP